LSTYGKDAFALLVDEGCMFSLSPSLNAYVLNQLNYSAGIENKLGTPFATLGVAEKGYTDVRVEVTSPGGHSSIPPPHTVSLNLCSMS
jgi:Gly-Xaa carboxypeptidase